MNQLKHIINDELSNNCFDSLTEAIQIKQIPHFSYQEFNKLLSRTEFNAIIYGQILNRTKEYSDFLSKYDFQRISKIKSLFVASRNMLKIFEAFFEKFFQFHNTESESSSTEMLNESIQVLKSLLYVAFITSPYYNDNKFPPKLHSSKQYNRLVLLEFKNTKLIKYLLDYTSNENNFVDCLLNAQLISNIKRRLLKLETIEFEIKLLSNLYLIYINNSDSNSLLKKICNDISPFLSETALRNFIQSSHIELENIHFIKFLNSIFSLSKIDISQFLEYIHKLLQEYYADSDIEKREFTFNFISDSLKNAKNVDLKINILKNIFHIVDERQFGLNMVDVRVRYYEYISTLSISFSDVAISDSVVNNNFNELFKRTFANEENDQCLSSLINALYSWIPRLQDETVSELLNFTFKRTVKLQKSCIIVMASFMKILATFTSRPNIGLNFINDNNDDFTTFMDGLFKPPCSSTISETALLCLVFCLNSDNTIFEKIVKRFYTVSNIKQVLHERNLITNSPSYFESIIILTLSILKKNIIDETIFQQFVQAIFHCDNISFYQYFELIKKDIEKISQQNLKIFYEQIIEYFIKNCILFREFIDGNSKVLPSWTKVGFHKITSIINGLFGFLLSKIQDNSFIVRHLIKLGFLLTFGQSDNHSIKCFNQLCHRLKLNPYIVIMDNRDIVLDVLFHQQYFPLKINCEATRMFLVFGQNMMPLILNRVFDVILSAQVLDISDQDMYIFAAPSDLYFDESLKTELTEAIESLPKNFKIENKKTGTIAKDDLFKMSISNLNSIIKDKSILDLLKWNQKFIKKLEDTFKIETEIREKIFKLKDLCETYYTILKGLIQSTFQTVLAHYSPQIFEKLFITVRSVFLSRNTVDCLLLLGEKIFPAKFALYGRMTVLSSLRQSGVICQLPVELVHTRLEVQVVHTAQNLVKWLSETPSLKFPLTFSITLLSMLHPLIANSTACVETLLNVDHFDNILSLVKILTTFSSFEVDLSPSLFNESIPTLMADIYQFLSYRIETFFDERFLVIQNKTRDVFKNFCQQHSIIGETILPPSQQVLCVFLNGTISTNPKVRDCAIYGLSIMSNYLNILDLENWLTLASRLLLLSFESDSLVSDTAKELIQKFDITFNEGIMFKLLDNTCHPDPCIREWSSQVLFESFSANQQYVDFFIRHQMDSYASKLKESDSNKEELEIKGFVEQRDGILLSLAASNSLFTESQVVTFLNFIMDQCSLDKSSEIQSKLIDVCVSVCNNHGSVMTDTLLLTLEQKSKAISKNKSIYNDLRQCIAIMMGSVSKFLSPESPLLPPIRTQLLVLLKSSKKKVQRMISLDLSHIIPETSSDFDNIVTGLLDQVFNIETSHRISKGCAMAVCGLAKIIGTSFIEKFKILQRIDAFFIDEKNIKKKTCSVVFIKAAFEISSCVFEPYSSSFIVQIVNCTNTTNAPLLKLSMRTGMILMKNLSSFGINYVFPALLKIIESKPKEQKSSAITILSSIANCSPKSLPSFLPKVVPVVVSLLRDSNDMISKAADSALKNILNVIKNPEIISVKQSVYSTLRDPVHKTNDFLRLFSTIKFEHIIDVGSLSLIIPIIIRALDANNNSTVKMMALDVIHTLSFLTKSEDLQHFSPSVVDKLKDIIFDTTPEVRNQAAVILGSLIHSVDVAISIKLIISLEQQLITTVNPIVQAGAAHGLAQILHGVNIEHLEEILMRSSRFLEDDKISPMLRNGYLLLYTHLPTVFGDILKKYTLQIIGPVIKNLSDISTEVSTTALLVGQSFVSCYGKDALEVIVPYLEEGLLDESWIVRSGSIKLLREVVITMCGFTNKSALVKSTDTADDNEQSNFLNMLEKLNTNMGMDVRNKLLAYIFISRCDLDPTVSDEAFKLWKNLVTGNSAQLLMEIASSILDILLWCFQQTSSFHLKFGVDTIKEIANKTSDRFLKELVTIVIKKSHFYIDGICLKAICIFIREYLSKVSKEIIGDNGPKLMEIITKSMLSSDSDLYVEAANSLSAIEKIFGLEILYPLIERILIKIRKDNQREKSISAFRYILQHNNIHLLKFILNKVLVQNLDLEVIQLINTQSSLNSEQALNILNSLIVDMAKHLGDSAYLNEASKAINSFNQHSTKIIMNKLLDMNYKIETTTLTVLTQMLLWCCERDIEYDSLLPKIHSCCMNLLHSESDVIIRTTMKIYQVILNDELDSASKRRNLELFIKEFSFNFGKYSAHKIDNLPALCIDGIGIIPFFPLFRHAVVCEFSVLLNSSVSTLSYLINLSTYESFKPIIKPLVGSMLRLLTRQVDWDSKFTAFEIIKTVLDIKSQFGLSTLEEDLSMFEPQAVTVFMRLINDSPASWVHRKKLCEYMIALKFLPYNVKECIQRLSEMCSITSDDTKM